MRYKRLRMRFDQVRMVIVVLMIFADVELLGMGLFIVDGGNG
jgi:hypothetical protein